MKGRVDMAGAALMALLLAPWLGPGLVLGTAQASEDAHDHSGVHEFHETMEELGEHTEQIVKAINHEDWQWVAEEARAIAEHPRPPAEERQRIMAFAGDRRAEFQQADHAAHEAAATLADVADAGDGREVIRAFADLQASCLACHASFRDDFRQHFYMGKQGENRGQDGEVPGRRGRVSWMKEGRLVFLPSWPGRAAFFVP